MMRALSSAAIVLFVTIAHCLQLHWSEGCHEEERRALLQIRDSQKSPIFPLQWVGDDCCQWDGVHCDPSLTFRVVGISVAYYAADPGVIWHPNATLFAQVKQLRYLIFGGYIGAWVMPEALCGLRHLRHLDLMANYVDDESLPRCLWTELSALESLYLSGTFSNGSFSTLNALCGLKNLQELQLSADTLVIESLPACLWSKLSLETLDLSNSHLNSSVGILNALCGLRNLRVLILSDNNLVIESLPVCLWSNLSSLEILGLSRNRFNGSFGTLNALCGLRNLRELYLSENGINDGSLPPCIWSNSSLLEVLALSGNNLKGSSGIPKEFCESRKLKELYLEDNLLKGSIPPCLGEMHSLTTLDLSWNQFKGSFSLTLWNSSTIEYIHVSNNQLEGVVSFSVFANLSTLQSIDLSSNQLDVETEFSSWVPSFQLHFLRLINCNVNKHRGSRIPSFLSTQYNLNVLSLSHNSLQGNIPAWILFNNSLDRLSLRGNSFNGCFPKYFQHNSSRLTLLDISDNHLDGPLPTNINRCFPKLFFLNMSSNALEGSIPGSLGNSMDLRLVELSKNYLTGKIPDQLTRNSSLLRLGLSNNQLHGELLPRHSNMPNLLFLYLHGNNFIGTIPASLMNSSKLIVLSIGHNNLSGKIPRWLAGFPNLASLVLNSNHFEGRIPLLFCQALDLHILDLSHNNLSGSIPSCLNQINAWKEESLVYNIQFSGSIESSPSYMGEVDFTTKGRLDTYRGSPFNSMTGIDFSRNRLTGNIPSQLGDLRVLHSLNLSNNLLEGPLPKSFQKLQNLESLDLSHNKLIGKIPPQYVQLNFLCSFSVAFNDLSGMIPFEKHFTTFNEISYRGNSRLCGPPLKKNCSGNSNPLQPRNNKKKDDHKELRIVESSLIFYSCFAISFILGFWGVIAPLLFSKKWRRKYYKTMDGNCERFLGYVHYLKNGCLNQ